MIQISLIDKKEAKEILSKYHYLGPVPGVIYAIGNVEQEVALCFGNLRSKFMERKFRLNELQPIELLRMAAVDGHDYYMSEVMAKAAKIVKDSGYDLIITYADPYVGHCGDVYRVSSWTQYGMSEKAGHPIFELDGKIVSPRGLYDRHGTQAVSAMKAIYGDRLKCLPRPVKARFAKILVKGNKKKLAESILLEYKEKSKL